jgi:hypothetical protein
MTRDTFFPFLLLLTLSMLGRGQGEYASAKHATCRVEAWSRAKRLLRNPYGLRGSSGRNRWKWRGRYSTNWREPCMPTRCGCGRRCSIL